MSIGKNDACGQNAPSAKSCSHRRSRFSIEGNSSWTTTEDTEITEKNARIRRCFEPIIKIGASIRFRSWHDRLGSIQTNSLIVFSVFSVFSVVRASFFFSFNSCSSYLEDEQRVAWPRVAGNDAKDWKDPWFPGKAGR